MCARDGRGAIEICLSEKGALAKKRLRNTVLYDDDYIKYGFTLLKCEESSHEPPALCMLSNVKYYGSNQCLAYSKLRSHLQDKHDIHHKFPQFFKQQHKYVCKQ